MRPPENPIGLRGIPEFYLPEIRGAIKNFQTVATSGDVSRAAILSGWELFAQYDRSLAKAKGFGDVPHTEILEALLRLKGPPTHQPLIDMACEQLSRATVQSDGEAPGVLLNGLSGEMFATAVNFCAAMRTAVTR